MEGHENGGLPIPAKEEKPIPTIVVSARMPGGATSNVYRVKLDGLDYAMKASLFGLEEEKHILSKLQSHHILPVLDSGKVRLDTSNIPDDRNNGVIVNTLRFKFIPDNLSSRLDTLLLEEKRQILAEQKETMNHMHAQGVVHTDIKGDNILLDGTTSYLSDFGNAKEFSLPEQQEEFDKIKQKDISDFNQMEREVLKTDYTE